jgi:hypothetical protein
MNRLLDMAVDVRAGLSIVAIDALRNPWQVTRRGRKVTLVGNGDDFTAGTNGKENLRRARQQRNNPHAHSPRIREIIQV